MRYVLYLGTIGSAFMAYSMFSAATGAVHEIEALICVLIAAVCLVGGAVVSRLEQAHRQAQEEPHA